MKGCAATDRGAGVTEGEATQLSLSIYFSLNQIRVFRHVQMRSPRSHSLKFRGSKESLSKCRCIDSEKIPAMSFFHRFNGALPLLIDRQVFIQITNSYKLLSDPSEKIKACYSTSAIRSVFP